jgi:hypothetical protein
LGNVSFFDLPECASYWSLFSLSVINSLEHPVVQTTRQQGADLSISKVVFHIELDRVNLIEESLLQPRILEHLPIHSCDLFLINDSLDGRIAGDEWCVRYFETLSGRLRGGRCFFWLLPTRTPSSSTSTTSTSFSRLSRFGRDRHFLLQRGYAFMCRFDLLVTLNAIQSDFLRSSVLGVRRSLLGFINDDSFKLFFLVEEI